MTNRDSNGEIIIYQSEDGTSKLDVKLEDETVWLTQAQLVDLFQSSKANVSEHIKNIYNEGELEESSTVREFRIVRREGSRDVARNIKHYNLDVIISLGYRIQSKVATHFRRWATDRIKEYIIKGFALDDERLKGQAGGNFWKELLDRVLSVTGRPVLQSAGKISHRQAMDKAKKEYREYQKNTLSPVEEDYL